MQSRKGKFDIGVFAVIFDEQKRVLHILRNDLDIWEIPGGGLESNETPEEAVLREIKEEVGLDVKVERLSGVYTRPHNNGIVFNFVCSVLSNNKVVLNPDEAREYAWFKVCEIPDNSDPYKIERIKDVLLNKKGVIFKIQDGPSVSELFS